MVPGERFEQATFGLQNRCTATVLTRHIDDTGCRDRGRRCANGPRAARRAACPWQAPPANRRQNARSSQQGCRLLRGQRRHLLPLDHSAVAGATPPPGCHCATSPRCALQCTRQDAVPQAEFEAALAAPVKPSARGMDSHFRIRHRAGAPQSIHARRGRQRARRRRSSTGAAGGPLDDTRRGRAFCWSKPSRYRSPASRCAHVFG